MVDPLENLKKLFSDIVGLLLIAFPKVVVILLGVFLLIITLLLLIFGGTPI